MNEDEGTHRAGLAADAPSPRPAQVDPQRRPSASPTDLEEPIP
jgi:hypothetical protein